MRGKEYDLSGVKAKEDVIFSQSLLRLIHKTSISTVKSLCVAIGVVLGLFMLLVVGTAGIAIGVVLGHFMFLVAVTAGIATGLVIAPIYAIKALVENQKERTYPINNKKDKAKENIENVKEELKSTTDYFKESQKYLASTSAKLQDEMNIKEMKVAELHNVRQRRMDKLI